MVFSGGPFLFPLCYRHDSIGFSMHRAQYVLNCVPLSGLNVPTPLIRPIVPIEIRSSCSHPGILYFLAICAHSRKLCAMSFSRATASPRFIRSIICDSSSRDKGFGKAFPCCRYPKRNRASLRKNRINCSIKKITPVSLCCKDDSD